MHVDKCRAVSTWQNATQGSASVLKWKEMNGRHERSAEKQNQRSLCMRKKQVLELQGTEPDNDAVKPRSERGSDGVKSVS